MKTLVMAAAFLLFPLAGCATQVPHGIETSDTTAATHRVCGTLIMADGGGGMPSPDPGWRPRAPSEYPFPGTVVRLLKLPHAPDGEPQTPGAEVARATTGADGTFCFEVPAGSYAVVVTESAERYLMGSEQAGFAALARVDVTVAVADVLGVVLHIVKFEPV